jgi:uncharacterized protein (TIGR03000 family)
MKRNMRTWLALGGITMALVATPAAYAQRGGGGGHGGGGGSMGGGSRGGSMGGGSMGGGRPMSSAGGSMGGMHPPSGGMGGEHPTAPNGNWHGGPGGTWHGGPGGYWNGGWRGGYPWYGYPIGLGIGLGIGIAATSPIYYDGGGYAVYSSPTYIATGQTVSLDSSAPPPQAQQGPGPSLSNYPLSPNKVRMLIVVPAPNAKLTLNGQATDQNGMERLFDSPAMEPGKIYVYAVQATWMQEGQEVIRRKSIDVEAGKEYVIDLRREAELAPPPLQKQQQ